MQLWITAIKLLPYVRQTMFTDERGTVALWDTEGTYTAAASRNASLSEEVYRRRRTSSVSSGGRLNREKNGLLGVDVTTPSYASKLTTSRTGNHAPSPSPRATQVLRAPRVRGRKGSHAGHATSKAARSDSGVETTDIDLAVQIRARMTMPPPRMIGPLPVDAWCKVLFLLCDPDDILSDRQRRQVVEYGQSRKTLRQEIEVLGKAQSAQIWLALDKMGCLMYDDVE